MCGTYHYNIFKQNAFVPSLTYSSDSMVLFGCYADGAVVAWESGAGSARAAPRVLPAHALL